MSTEPHDLGTWIQGLVARSVQDQMRAMQRYGELVQQVSRGGPDQEAVREAYLRFVRDESGRYVRNLATLGLSFYEALLELGRSYTERFFQEVFGAAGNGEAAPAEPQRVAMELAGPVGGEAVRTFVVENKRAQPAEISFIVSEFTGPAGTAPFRPPLQLRPPRFALGPQEERAVELRLPLLPELFAAGERYEATVVVRGHDDLELLLDVRAYAAPEPPAPPPAPEPPAGPPQARPARKPKPAAAKPAVRRKPPAARRTPPAARRKPSAPRRKPPGGTPGAGT